MRPTLPCLCLLTAAHLQAAEVHWDGGAGSSLWSAAENWSTDLAPSAGDTVWFGEAPFMPAMLTLDASYPDTGAPLNLVFAAGTDLTLSALAGRELYLNSLTVVDAHTYTLHVPRNGTQGASGTMPASGATWDIAAGGTMVVLEDFGSKAFATGTWAKTGEGTLRLGGDCWSTLASPRLTYRALGGLTEIGCLLGAPVNGIAEVAAGATVRFTCYNPCATLMLSGTAVYRAGVTGLAGTLDLGGFDQQLRALSGTQGGLVLGNGGLEVITLTLGVGDLATTITREADGDFAGNISDGTGRLRLVVHGGRDGYTQTLSGSCSHTGGTVLRGGRLRLANPTGTLTGGGSLQIDGGVLDVGNHAESVGDLLLYGGSVTGGGNLRAVTLTANNAAEVDVAPQLIVQGMALKLGAGRLNLAGGLVVGEGLTIGAGMVDLRGGTLIGDVVLQDGGLVGGTYDGNVSCRGPAALSGEIPSGRTLNTYLASIQTDGLVINGRLEGFEARFEGGIVTVNGEHGLVSWFGVNTFVGGLAYGLDACVELGFGDELAALYVDGTTVGERGAAFGAIDVGGAGLSIAEGARLRLGIQPTSDPFWASPRRFKFAGLLDGATITGAFLLEQADGTAATGWSIASDEGGLYLTWAGWPERLAYTAVPEASTLPWAAAGAGLAMLLRGAMGVRRK